MLKLGKGVSTQPSIGRIGGEWYIGGMKQSFKHQALRRIKKGALLLCIFAATTLTACSNNELEKLQQEAWKNPNDAALTLQLGYKYAQEGRYMEANESFQKVLALDPKRDEALQALGATAFRQKQYSQAISYFQQHLERAPADSARLYNLGNAYMQLKQYDKATELYNKAIDNSTAFIDAHYNLAVCYAKTGRRNEAQAIYEWLLTKNNYLATSLQKHLDKENQAPK
uniref:TPR repeat n=1 Tax=Chlorobium chlorochromatii (strain CaD3) TaxID=340177 RepID=Q3APX2_CHLCH